MIALSPRVETGEFRTPWLIVDFLPPNGAVEEYWEYRPLTEGEVREGWGDFGEWGVRTLFFRIATAQRGEG